MKKFAYLLACLSIPLAGLFALLPMLARASATPPTAAPLPIQKASPAGGSIEAYEDDAFQREESLLGIRGGDGQTVDIVFAMDTSGSMSDEFSALCSKISEVINELQGRGVFVNYRILGITANRECATDNVRNVVGPFNATVNQVEDWGPAVVDLSRFYAWTPGAVRMIIPVSGEGAQDGNPVDDPGNDREAISDAIAAARANQVIVSPVMGTPVGAGPWEDPARVEELMRDLADGTGGRFFSSSDPATDLASAIIELIGGAVKPDLKGEKEPTTLPPESLRETDSSWGGDEDEVFVWTQEHIDDLLELRKDYHNSKGTSSPPITIPITRYYGETKPDHTLEDKVVENVIQEAKLVICSWDVDPGENISLKINGSHAFYLEGEDRKWDCRSYSLLPDLIKLLWFPQNPGAPSDPTAPSDIPGTPDEEFNTITITYSSDYKALIYGMRLIIEAVRPVVLVPGFGGDAIDYDWGEVEATLKKEGVIVKRPCNYRWIYACAGQSCMWGREIFDEDEPPDCPVDPCPYPSVHRRCFEAARAEGQERNGIGTLDKNAEALMWTIDELKTRYGVTKVNLVGHSKGGLFSRAYVDIGDYQKDVENLISISSPHQGIYLMDLATDRVQLPDDWRGRIECDELGFKYWLHCSLPAGLLQGFIEKSFGRLFKANDTAGQEVTSIGEHSVDNTFGDAVPKRGVVYHSVMATAGIEEDPSRLDPAHDRMNVPMLPDNLFGLFAVAYRVNYSIGDLTDGDEFFQSVQGQSDIGITTVSQRMDKLEEYGSFANRCTGIRANHEKSSRIIAAANAVAKALDLPYDGSELLNCDDILQEGPEAPTGGVSTGIRALINGEHTEHVLSFSGVITYGQTADVSFAVDGSNLETIALWDGDANVTLTLSDSTGAVITPTVAAGDDNIDYYEERDIDTGVGIAIYTITDTVKGMWIAHIAAPASGTATEPVQWDLMVSQRSPISFTLSTIPLTVTFGNSLTLRATPMTLIFCPKTGGVHFPRGSAYPRISPKNKGVALG